MGRRYRENRTLIHLIAAYVLLLLVPITIGAGVMIRQYMRYIEAQTQLASEEKLGSIEKKLGTMMSDISRIALEIQGNDALALYRLRKSTYYVMQAKRQLQSYKAGNSALIDIAYSTPQGDILFSSKSSYSRDSFSRLYYGQSASERADFWALVDGAGSPVMLKPQSVLYYKNHSRRVLTCLYPLPTTNSQSYSMLIFLLDADALDDDLRAPLSRGFAYVLDAQEQLLFSSDWREEALYHSFEQALAQRSDAARVRLDGEEYLVSERAAGELGWRYRLAIPVSAVFSQISFITAIFLGFTLTLLLLSLLYFGVGIKYNYDPLRRLYRMAQGVTGAAGGRARNEYEAVSTVITELTYANRALRQQMVDSFQARRDFLLSQMLLGMIPDYKTLWQQASELELCFDRRYFGVALLSAAQGAAAKDPFSAPAHAFLEEKLHDALRGCAMKSMQPGTLIVIYNVDSHNPQVAAPIFTRLQQELTDFGGPPTTVSLGGLYEEPGSLGKSYMEASYAAQYHGQTGQNAVLLFDNVILNDNYESVYPDKAINSLRAGLLQGDAQRVGRAIDKILDVIHVQALSIPMVRFICYDVIQSVISYLRDSESSPAALTGSGQPLPDIHRILSIDSVHALVECVREIRPVIQAFLIGKSTALEQRAADYIHKHYSDANFSVQGVADSLGVSSGHLSRYFKRTTGRTLIEYINHVRIEEAKRLLAQTEEPIHAIVRKVGYIDASSFNRKFKQAVGETPGSYRSRHSA